MQGAEAEEKVRALAVKETELRETITVVRETHRVEITRLVESHATEVERTGAATTTALKAGWCSLNLG